MKSLFCIVFLKSWKSYYVCLHCLKFLWWLWIKSRCFGCFCLYNYVWEVCSFIHEYIVYIFMVYTTWYYPPTSIIIYQIILSIISHVILYVVYIGVGISGFNDRDRGICMFRVLSWIRRRFVVMKFLNLNCQKKNIVW